MNNDQPKTLKEEDRFQRYEFSKRIAVMIEKYDLQQSLVIGLYGKWGEGKTSVLNFIKQELPSDAIVVNFNPWLFTDQEHLIQSFFNSIAFELNTSLSSKKEKAGKILSDYGAAIGSVTKLAGFSLDGVGQIGDKLKSVSIEKLKERVDKIIKESGQKIIVCIDDIDRLDVQEVQYIFKLVKLVGDFPQTTYLLAFDDEMVATSLAPKYGNQDKRNGYLFLEKIIQVPLKIPKASKKALRQYTVDLINKVFQDFNIKMEEKGMASFGSGFEECFVPQIDNPRLGVRYANTLSFVLPLLEGEVYTADLMLVEGLKVFFPEAYDFVRENSSIFLTDTSRQSSFRKDELTKDDIKKRIDKFLTIYSKNKAKNLLTLMQELFPQVFFVYKNYMVGDEAWKDWLKNKRICSGKYFERYFSYVVQEGDISDVFFTQLLNNLELSTYNKLSDELIGLFNTVNGSDLIFKLRLWEEQLSYNQSKSLAIIIVRQSEKFPIEPGEFRSFTTHAEAGKTIARLILNLPKKERAAFTKEVLENCDSLLFCLEITNWLFYKNPKENIEVVTNKETIDIQNYLITRFKGELNTKDIFNILPDTEFWRLLTWWSKREKTALNRLLKKEIGNNLEKVTKFIKVFTPTVTSYGINGSEQFKSGFEQIHYDAIAKVIDTKFVYDVLKMNNIKATDINTENNTGRARLLDKELAGIYMGLYEKSKSEIVI
jgi:hypothetical protein